MNTQLSTTYRSGCSDSCIEHSSSTWREGARRDHQCRFSGPCGSTVPRTSHAVNISIEVIAKQTERRLVEFRVLKFPKIDVDWLAFVCGCHHGGEMFKFFLCGFGCRVVTCQVACHLKENHRCQASVRHCHPAKGERQSL